MKVSIDCWFFICFLLMYIYDVGVDLYCIVVLKSKMVVMLFEVVDFVLFFCDIFSYFENEVS